MRLAWQVPVVDQGRVTALAAELGVRPLTARLLVTRGLHDPTAAARFLAPRLGELRLPDGIADLGATIERLVTALERRELIGIFGDYDVDGVTTAAILTSALQALGARVVTRVASRFSGYGLGAADAARFADEGCTLLLAGDCGTSDLEALQLCRARGVDAIVIDHHCVPPAGTNPAYALINPHRQDDRFPFKGLASCGIAFYVAAALRTRLRAAGRDVGFDPRDLLDLVALGTVADMVPMVDANRILTAAGLRVVEQRRRPGLRALCLVSGLDADSGVDTETVSFRLAPRLNAAGRLGDAQLALDVLLAPDHAAAARSAQALDEQNKLRQRIQEGVWEQAQAAAAAQEGRPALVVAGDGWHPGVIGIVAAKLVERFGRPAIVIGFDEHGQGRGSARTVRGFDLFEALQACAGRLVRFGGHAAAAGLTVTRDSLDGFRADFAAEAERRLQARPADQLAVDAEVSVAELDLDGVLELERLAPHGVGNQEPVLVLRGVTTATTRRVGSKHLQLTVRDGSATADAIAFGMAERDPGPGARIDLVVSAEVDSFRGNRRARLRVQRLEASSQSAAEI